MTRKQLIFRFTLVGILLLTAAPIITVNMLRPPRTSRHVALFQGISYERQVRRTPRPLTIHILLIDLTAPGLRFFVTDGDEQEDGMAYYAQTTPAFLVKSGVQLAINANFFTPFRESTPWNYYPRAGDPIRTFGRSTSNGKAYSGFEAAYPVLCIAGTAVQISHEDCPPGTEQAIAGNHILVENGQPAKFGDQKLHPRTAIALSIDGLKMWLVVIDGRQPGYSEGTTLDELAAFLVELGADIALNLDGGGSTSMVMVGQKRPITLNSPIHTRIPTRHRPVANHLGIFALPIDLHASEQSAP